MDYLVCCDGTVARLTCMEPRVGQEEEDSKKRKRNDDNDDSEQQQNKKKLTAAAAADDGEAVKKDEPSISSKDIVSWALMESELAKLIGDEKAAQSAREYLQRHSSSSNDDEEMSTTEQFFFTLPRCEDKNTRRQLHEWIRSRLGNDIAQADTTPDKAIRLWPKKFQRHMPKAFDNNRRSNNNKQKPPPPPPHKYLRFVLYKENMDTGSALNILSSKFNNNNHRGHYYGRPQKHNNNKGLRVGYAGMKDKRGITSQFITVPSHTSLQMLCNSFNNKSGGGGGGNSQRAGAGVIRVGNFDYVADELRLGRLSGNRFDIVLRNVKSVNSTTTSGDLKALLTQSATLLREHGFINYFGVQRFGKYHDTHLTGMAVLKGDFEKAVNYILQPKPDERDDIQQARRDWQNRFEEESTEQHRAEAERTCARKIVDQLRHARFLNSELAILHCLKQHALDYKRAFLCISKTMRMMFIHAFQSYLWNCVASFRLTQMDHQKAVCKGDLVLEGCSEANDDQQAQERSLPPVKCLTEEDIASGRYTIYDVVLPLIGTKTRLPDNASGQRYTELLKKLGIDAELLQQTKQQQRDFECGGDYRKLLVRSPDFDFEIIEYQDPLEPLLQTDLMKCLNIELPPKSDYGSAAASSAEAAAGIETDAKAEEAAKKADAKQPPPSDRTGQKTNTEDPLLLLAMKVGFTLPSSSYATIALRELMKTPTSSEYQKLLALDNKRVPDEETEDDSTRESSRQAAP